MTIDLEAIRARAAAATPGPWLTDPNSAWRRCHEAHEYVYASDPTDRNGVIALTGIKGEHVRNGPDATFIAHARTDVTDLCDEVEQVRDALARRDKEIGRLEVYVTGLEQQLAAQQPVINAARDLTHIWAANNGDDTDGIGIETDAATAEGNLRRTLAQLDTKQPETEPNRDADSGHVLVVTETGGPWTLRHPVSCTGDCPMFALMHTAMATATAEIPAGQYEVEPSGLWDRVFIGDRIDGPAVIQ
ncbi:hypothetical protein OHB44_27880 [Micromonospora sp. NBC_00821]|uniref:hypothetical protein n=1 Tax=Micromonospora sp. NBC_00821 TaxID=2975977 RepID=UPI002ECFF058|nr:hypothetical protein OHB44_27880 [Micromonospora sp. NBC_00821]